MTTPSSTPNFEDAFLLYRNGNFSEAAELCRWILRDRPDCAEALHLLGAIDYLFGRKERAVEQVRQAIACEPTIAEFYNTLGQILIDLQQWNDSENAYQTGLSIDNRHFGLWMGLGTLFTLQSRWLEALQCYSRAASIAPGNPKPWPKMVNCFRNVHHSQLDERLVEALACCFAHPHIDPTPLTNLAVETLLNLPAIQLLHGFTEHAGMEDWLKQFDAGQIQLVMNHALLVAFLEREHLHDLTLEAMLVRIRRVVLHFVSEPATEHPWLPSIRPFLNGLAQQCYLNQYLYEETPEETEWIARLEERISNDAAAPMWRDWIVLLAAYRPLHRTRVADCLAARVPTERDADLKKLTVRQILEPRCELEIQKEIPQLTSLEDRVSLEVRNHYEDSPYPLWQISYPQVPRPVGDVLCELFPHLKELDISYPASPQILVAGCGTGREAIVVSQLFLGAQVLAIDLSRASLSHAVFKAREYNAANLEFAQADLLSLEQCGRTFDLISCNGVLHHLGDPMRGWRILTASLNPAGWMRIGLYSELGRRHIVAAREWARERGYENTPEAIRCFRREVMALPVDHPVRQIAKMGDFYSLAECRDLIFHVQEHRFTLPQINQLIYDLKLQFVGFDIHPQVRQRYLDMFPENPDANDLERWDRYEHEYPDTFRSMYQFWVRKSGL